MKKKIAAILSFILCMTMVQVSFGSDLKTSIINLKQEAEKRLEEEIGAFEITADQRKLAQNNEAGYPVLDEGRGNPNWITHRHDMHSHGLWIIPRRNVNWICARAAWPVRQNRKESVTGSTPLWI